MKVEKVIGIGWDVGGWMGKNHGVAICQWTKDSNEISWLGEPTEVSLPPGGLLTLRDLFAAVHSPLQLEDVEGGTLVVIGVDAPLGYPKEFIRLLNGGTPSVGRPEKEIHNPLAYRTTDIEIHRVFAKKPLSAVFDRIGNNATTAMVHARVWEQENNFKVYPFRDKAKSDNRIIVEVYPALLKEKRFGEVRGKFRQFMPPKTEAGTDAYDACICALFGVAFGTNGNLLPTLKGPEAHQESDAREEGWIYYIDLTSM
ncbi:DUF429 domain-containing protein [Evansella sp. AB-rgal1]|uniref:DUF429 domain-containing protein n=1 Tax=Evansella sp. AB-rgal1 TaxID=3242696 RepID=UPI00359E347A